MHPEVLIFKSSKKANTRTRQQDTREQKTLILLIIKVLKIYYIVKYYNHTIE